MHPRLPPQIQDGSPETWRGEGYASNSRGEQGAAREEGPGSTEHLSLRFLASRGPSCSSEGLKPMSQWVAPPLHIHSPHLHPKKWVQPSRLHGWPALMCQVSSHIVLVTAPCLPGPQERGHPSSTQEPAEAWRQHPQKTDHSLLLNLTALLWGTYCCGFHVKEGEMGSERTNALSKVAQNFNVHSFQHCLSN